MSTFVLVHGGWAGGWKWEKVVPLLQAEGHRVVAPDLPGHGDDPAGPSETSLASYVERVCSVVAAQDEPVILVGHSSGGQVIAQTAEEATDHIALLVYLCAFVPEDGQSVLDLGMTATDSVLVSNLMFAEDGTTVTIAPDAIRAALYGDCSEADYRRAVARLRPEPVAPVATPVSLTERRFGRVPKAYIECLQDRALPLSMQRRMYRAAGIDTVLSLDTGHSPQYAGPPALAAHLVGLARAETPRPQRAADEFEVEGAEPALRLLVDLTPPGEGGPAHTGASLSAARENCPP